MIKLYTHDEFMKMWNHCVRNVRQLNGTMDYNLVELGMVYSYDKSTNSSSDYDTFFPFFLRKSRVFNGGQVIQMLGSEGF